MKEDYADWIRKDGLQAGRPGPVVSSDWTDKMVEVAEHIETLESRLDSATKLKEKLLLDTGKGCSICGHTPVVNIPGGSGTYWLCGNCVGEKLETACSLDHEWRSSTFEEYTSPHWVCRRCGKAEPKSHGEEFQRDRIGTLQEALNAPDEPLPFWLTCKCGWSSGPCRDDCWRVKEWRANGRESRTISVHCPICSTADPNAHKPGCTFEEQRWFADVRLRHCRQCGEPLEPRHECVGVKECHDCGGWGRYASSESDEHDCEACGGSGICRRL